MRLVVLLFSRVISEGVGRRDRIQGHGGKSERVGRCGLLLLLWRELGCILIPRPTIVVMVQIVETFSENSRFFETCVCIVLCDVFCD